MKIGFLPIDNRPVCYLLPEQIGAIDSSLELILPERELLGDLTKTANVEKLFEWLESLQDLDALVLSLDTIAYGGLIPSRRSPDSFEEILARIEKLKEILESKNTKIYAFSSIMRISNNNINEEEKEYWSQYGTKIFDYSYETHKYEGCEVRDIPDEILTDYLATRKRNFEINKKYLAWQKEGFFETLVFSKDDCAEYGFNVQEAQALEHLGGFTKTGADEIPLSLMTRAVVERFNNLKIAPVFLEPEYKDLISNYEDVSIENSVKGQIELAGCVVSDVYDADISLYVNNFIEKQGEIVMERDTIPFSGDWREPDEPYMVADVRYANGSDNRFIYKFLEKSPGRDFYGYAGWNTSANTLGSLICVGIVKYFALENNTYNDAAFKKLQLIRLLDDWAYQANVRQAARSLEDIKSRMKGFEQFISGVFMTKFTTEYMLPWNRFFEIEVAIDDIC